MSEIDPRIGLRGFWGGFGAIKALKRDYAWAIDRSALRVSAGSLTNDPGHRELLGRSLARRRRAISRLSLCR